MNVLFFYEDRLSERMRKRVPIIDKVFALTILAWNFPKNILLCFLILKIKALFGAAVCAPCTLKTLYYINQIKKSMTIDFITYLSSRRRLRNTFFDKSESRVARACRGFIKIFIFLSQLYILYIYVYCLLKHTYKHSLCLYLC